MRVFYFNDGENHWIAAETKEEAISYFLNEYEGNEDYELEEVVGAELDLESIDNGECPSGDKYSHKRFVSFNQIMEGITAYPCVLASSVY